MNERNKIIAHMKEYENTLNEKIKKSLFSDDLETLVAKRKYITMLINSIEKGEHMF